MPIYLRIAIAGKRAEFSTGRSCEPIRWPLQAPCRRHTASFSGKQEKPRMLVEELSEHNRRKEALVGKDFSPATLKGYLVCGCYALIVVALTGGSN